MFTHLKFLIILFGVIFINSVSAYSSEKIAEYFDEKSKTITNDILKIMKRDDSKFNALLNGAFDINNIYFKNDENQKPVGIR